MNISIIGTGYVGLVSGACLAKKGHLITCVDIDQHKIEQLKKGICPIYEEGLPEILDCNIGKNLFFSSNLKDSVKHSDVIMICVGTPFNGEQIDLSFLETVSFQIGEIIKSCSDRKTVIVKSTVIPGTTEKFVAERIENSSGKIKGQDFGLGMNPEFLREGSAVSDFMSPDRIVLGGTDKATLKTMKEIYAPFRDVDIIETNCTTAELIKYVSNSYLATLISFSNELGNLCYHYKDVDALDVFNGLHKDRRLSPIINGQRIFPDINAYLKPGCGFGGSCFPKDVKSLISEAKKSGIKLPILDSVIQTNNNQPYKMIEMLQKHIPKIKGATVGILGLAFKPGTDDLRESPSLRVIDELAKLNVNVMAHDPIALEPAKNVIKNPNVTFMESLEEIVEKSDSILLMTAWDEYIHLDKLLMKYEKDIPVIDGRRVLNKNNFKYYSGIGISK